ncbi:hypothetical protein HYPSUDRAFT_202163 [Hypholoma sublateritium FD-334 SS-4]|uniref:Uncharacterized protein n=1 Tax=Hypholoma sublateritium (strain FD-334 SS-4) TaxID=945553 RepID=A0A0D2P0W2_HYPSF|nr:hypothetical protein HYPSUDRAFT_202163 [Hypholoma sublateritium FD-334 SS-4]
MYNFADAVLRRPPGLKRSDDFLRATEPRLYVPALEPRSRPHPLHILLKSVLLHIHALRANRPSHATPPQRSTPSAVPSGETKHLVYRRGPDSRAPMRISPWYWPNPTIRMHASSLRKPDFRTTCLAITPHPLPLGRIILTSIHAPNSIGAPSS